eukprot:1183798-Prorocentrum_minimum.AAC.1
MPLEQTLKASSGVAPQTVATQDVGVPHKLRDFVASKACARKKFFLAANLRHPPASVDRNINPHPQSASEQKQA